MNKVLVFDMDGTIADLYGVEGWLDMLRAEDATPYAIAKPMYKMDILNTILTYFRMAGWKIAVTTWLAKGAGEAYNAEVARVKKEWLDKYGFPYDMFEAQVYGEDKNKATEKMGGYQVLVDDNAEVRKNWKLGKTINANKNIIIDLANLLDIARV